MKGGVNMSPEILAIIGLIAVPALVWAWAKFVKPLFEKNAIVAVVAKAIADGELTKEEAQEIIDELRKLFE
jgi:uncharacterized membrane protein YebE (DUF533 family)